MDTFGEWLRWQREQRRLTREQLAGRVGCSVALLRKIESGERRPSVQVAELLANCLEVPPGERETFVRVARGELNLERLPAAYQPAPNPMPASSNLPVFPTPLIGRQGEMAELSRLLGDTQCRLLTLVGPGGIGKTRLAIEAVARRQAAFTGGVYFVPFASVNNTRFIVPVIADALGFAFQSAGSTDPKSQLFNYLREKQILLLVDNLEHLLAGPGIETLAELLEHAPLVKLLATSRESLGLPGEWVYEVLGLPVPDSLHVEGSAQDTSAELFLQRARRAHVGFNAAAEDYPAILRICQLVGGIPLGIELAAAWVRALSCAEIAGEIERGLDFLSVSTRDLPPRHRSMRAVFDQSWKLLVQEEQDVLLRLSVFQGGFRREAAEQAAGATLPVLSALVTKSLVRRSNTGRYDLHELIRQFAAEQFARLPDEDAAARARHSRYYLDFFTQADGRLRSSGQRQAFVELIAEMDNFRAAWDWAVAHGEFVWIEGALRTMQAFYDINGWLQEGIDQIGPAIRAIETAHGQAPADRMARLTLGHLLAAHALFSFRLARHEEAQALLERSLDLLRPLNEPRLLVEALTFLGVVKVLVGNYAGALEALGEGEQMAEASGDRWFGALCRNQRASVILRLGRAEEAYRQLKAVVAEWRNIGDLRSTTFGLNILGQSALALGRFDEARAALEEIVTLVLSLGDRASLGAAYRGLGSVAQVQGQHTQAVDMYRKSLEVLNELGARQDAARTLAEMGRSIYALGDDGEAGRTWRLALRMAVETQGAFIALEALVGLARLQVKGGETAPALELLLIVLDHPALIQDTRNRAARLCNEIEAQLTVQQVETARALARAKNFDDIVKETLGQP